LTKSSQQTTIQTSFFNFRIPYIHRPKLVFLTYYITGNVFLHVLMSNVSIEEGQHILPSRLFGGQLELGGKMLQSDIVGPHHHMLGAM
jgi:hypothetical protein